MTDRKKSIRLIVHLKHSQRPDLREAVEAIRSRGHCVEVHVAWEPADTRTLSREACIGGRVRTIVAAGGDGTVNSVAEGLLQESCDEPPSVGVLPLGTANDFASAVGIGTDDLVEALRIAAECPAKSIDVGQAGNRYFLNVATGGVGTSVTVDTPEPMKKVLGKAAYFITGLRELGNIQPLFVRLDAGPDGSWEGNSLVLAVGNARFAGGGFDLCPDAKLDDGLLEISIVPDSDPEQRTVTLREIIQGGMNNVTSKIIRKRAADFTIRADAPFQLNLDGEPLEDREFRFRTAPLAIRLHLPEECPLIGRKLNG